MPLLKPCPSCLVYQCYHVLHKTKSLTVPLERITRNYNTASQAVKRHLETEEQTTKNREFNRDCVTRSRSLETNEQTEERRKVTYLGFNSLVL